MPANAKSRPSEMKDVSDLTFLGKVQDGADIALNSEILFGNLQVAKIPFFELYNACMKETRTPVSSWKVFRRAQRAFVLARYVEYAQSLAAPKIECGVFQGFSALLACKVQRALSPDFDGSAFYILDSFEGLSAPIDEDKILVTSPDGRSDRVASHQERHFAVPLQTVSSHFTAFPKLNFIKGWIPAAFSDLPDTSWSFVHIDVDLYDPTLACLDYFFPRMVPGGVILNDDFSSPLFPGGGKAWAKFFEDRQLPYVVLDTGQSIYVKPSK